MIKKFDSKCSEAAVNMLQANGLDCDAVFHGSDLRSLTIRIPGIERGLILDAGGYGSLFFKIPVPLRIEKLFVLTGILFDQPFRQEFTERYEAEDRLDEIRNGLVTPVNLTIEEEEREIWE